MSGPGGGVGPPENSRRGPGQKFTLPKDLVNDPEVVPALVPVHRDGVVRAGNRPIVHPCEITCGEIRGVIRMIERAEIL